MFKSFLFAAVALMLMVPVSFAQGAVSTGSSGRHHTMGHHHHHQQFRHHHHHHNIR